MTIIELYNILKIEIDNGYGDNIACVHDDWYEVRSLISIDNDTLISAEAPK